MPKEEKYTEEQLLKMQKEKLDEMKSSLDDLRVEEEYWRMISSIAESKHKLFIIKLKKAEYATDKSDSSKETSK